MRPRILRIIVHRADNEVMTDRGADHPFDDARTRDEPDGLGPLRRVLDAASVPTATLDGEGQIVSLNPAFARLCGRGASEIIGLHLLSLCPGRDQADVVAKLVRIVGGVSEIEQEHLRVADADGTVRTLSITLGGLVSSDGRVERVIAVAADATDERRARRNQRRATVELAREVLADAETGFPNGRALVVMTGSAVRRAAQHDAPFALLRCEITNLQDIRNGCGSPVARDVAGRVAERLNQRLRSEDTVTRSSTGVFTVIAEDLSDVQDAAGVAYRLLASVVEPVVVDASVELSVDMVVGIAVGDGSSSPDRLVTDAANAATAARSDGVGGFRIIDSRTAPAA